MMRLAWQQLLSLVLILICASVTDAQSPAPLTIDQVVARFLERNLAVEAARLRVDIARAERIAAQIRPNPTLTLSAENLKRMGYEERELRASLNDVGSSLSQLWDDVITLGPRLTRFREQPPFFPAEMKPFEARRSYD